MLTKEKIASHTKFAKGNNFLAVIRYGVMKYDIMKYDVMKYDVMKNYVTKYDIIKCDVMKYDAIISSHNKKSYNMTS